MSRAREAAARVHHTLTQRQRLEPLEPALRPRTLEEAYAVQDALIARLRAERGSIAGYKLALTTETMQRLLGASDPCSALLFESGIFTGDVRVAHADFVRATVEAEVAVLVGRDLPKRMSAYAEAEVADSIASWMAGIELVDDTASDYGTTTGLDLISWNVWNRGLVLGTPNSNLAASNFATARVRMRVGSGEWEEGSTRDVLGHPITALTWLANHLIARGESLREGMIVTTGCIVGPRWPARGDRIELEVEGLEPASLHFD